MKTANSIEATKSAVTTSVQPATTAAEKHKKESAKARSLANLVAPWPKGVSGNPAGRRKNDLAKEIAQAIFSQNEEAIYKAMVRPLLEGNAYAYGVLADRAFGKLKETKEITHIHEDIEDADLAKRVSELEHDLGLAEAIDDAGRVGIAKARAAKANGSAKDTPVLS